MPFANDFFSACLTARIDADSVYLPLSPDAKADLLRIIPQGSYTYASLVNDSAMETVLIRNDHGTLLTERGFEGTSPVAHPPGTCVRTVSPTIIAAIKDLICTWECCKSE